MNLKHVSRLSLVILTLLMSSTPRTLFAQHPVDPATLNPPIPPEFNPVCKSIGAGTICTVQFTQLFPGGSGVICATAGGTYEVLQTQTRSVEGHRYYDQNGDLTRRLFHEVDTGTYINPIAHVSVSFSARLTTLHDLSIPGDINSGTQAVTGPWRVFLPRGGVVVIEVGRLLLSGDGNSVLSESGPHPFLAYFALGDTAALQPLCDALR